MRALVVGLALWLSLSVSALALEHPTCRDVTIRIPKSSAYVWFRTRVATQPDRELLEEQAFLCALDAVALVQRLPQSAGVVQNLLTSYVNPITPRLGPEYEFKASTWTIQAAGHHYSFEQYNLAKAQAFLLAKANAARCGQLLTPALSDALDLRVDELGRCVVGAPFVIPPPSEPLDTAKGNVGAANFKQHQPALTDTQRALLAETHAAHVAVSDWRCGLREQPTESVVGAHLALESSAQNETERHFFQLKQFSGALDPAWSTVGPDGTAATSQVCRIARQQDAAHACWHACLLAGDWHCARTCDNDHQLWHHCANHGAALPFLVRFSCGQYIDKCPAETCAQALTRMGG